MDSKYLGFAIGYGGIVTVPNGNIWACGLITIVGHLGIVYSSDGGTTWQAPTSGSVVTDETMYGSASSTYGDGDIATDSNGVLHVVVGANAIVNSRSYVYATYNTTSGSWSSWETIDVHDDASTPPTSAIHLALDSNGKPHVLFNIQGRSMGSGIDGFYYRNKTGASWSAREQVSTTLLGMTPHGSILVVDNGVVEANYNRGSAGYCFRTRTSGTWGTETYTVSSQKYPGKRAILYTSGSTFRYNGYYNGGFLENGTQVSSIPTAEYFGVTTSGSTKYVIYQDYADDDIKYIKYDGSWSSPTTLFTYASGLTRTGPEYSYYFEYQSNRINYYYGGNFNYINLGTSYTLTPTAVSAAATTITPTVNQGSLLLSPAIAIAVTSGSDPTIQTEEGGQTCYPNPVTGSVAASLEVAYSGWVITPGATNAQPLAKFQNARLKIGWATFYRDIGDNIYLVAPVKSGTVATIGAVLVSGQVSVDLTGQEAAASTWAIAPSILGNYRLWRWNGTQWENETVYVFDTDWVTKPLYVWLEGDWRLVG